MKYIFMNRKAPVFLFTMDESGEYIEKINEIYDISRLPVGIPVYSGIPDKASLNRWWKRRAIPDARKGLQAALHELGVCSQYELVVKSLGLSLTDQYWINPEGKLEWEKVNFFHNEFSNYVGDVLYSHSSFDTAKDLMSPCCTSDGNLLKKWIYRNGEQLLMKGGSGFYQEPYNEVLATAMHRRMDVVPYVEYWIENENGMPCSVCRNFVESSTEFVPAYYFLDLEKKSNDISYYQHLLNLGEREGIEGLQEFLDYLLATDFLIANVDRHLNNFGFIRNVDTLKWSGIAPVFDSGNSLYFDKSEGRMDNGTLDVPSMPFKKWHSEQIKLIHSFEHIDIEKLKGLDEEFREIIRPSIDMPESRKDSLCKCLKNRIQMLEAEKERRVEKNKISVSQNDYYHIFKDAGYVPTDTLISNLKKLNLLLGKTLSMQEVKEKYENLRMLNGKEKYYVKAIGEECISQELSREQLLQSEIEIS